MNEFGPAPPYFAHETAIIDPGAKIGPGTIIWHWVHVGPTATIGANCSLGQNVYVGRARIGNNVKVQNNVSVYDAVVLEDDVFCGPSMVFTNVINPRSHIVRKSEYKETLVKRGATIGANAVILCGNTIGTYAMIGAGAVITKDVPDYALVVGNPGRKIGWICQCGIRLEVANGNAHCVACASNYEVVDTCCRPVGAMRIVVGPSAPRGES
jgi:UDP-2-acetamido-3-amino-2,3-dideoxy-glucuronate N-acetyltransferase